VSLLEPEYYERYLRDPGLLSSDVEGALKGQHLAVLIDEIQKLSALLGFSIAGWHESTVKQLRTAPKFFLFDNGVANALRGELRIELSERTSRFGGLFTRQILRVLFSLSENTRRAKNIAFAAHPMRIELKKLTS
jgi:hypothetical protein